MPQPLPDSLLERFSGFVTLELGLDFPRFRWRELERGIASAALEFGMENTESCAEWLMSAPLTREQTEVLAGALTIGETYFFRDKASFTALREKILPELIRARQNTSRRLRIWSAGCCTGEEAYSVAITLKRLLPDLDQWRVTILGTDVNPQFLKKAAEGVFGEWSFRDAPSWLKPDYFRPVDDRHYQIAPSIRSMVRFSHLNLAKDHFPSFHNDTNAMDVVLCRNVLMYFSPEQAKRTVGNLRSALTEEGWLIVSSTEVSSELFSNFTCLQSDNLTLYRKIDSLPAAGPPLIERETEAGALPQLPQETTPATPSQIPRQDMVPTPSPFPAAKPNPPRAPAITRAKSGSGAAQAASTRYSEAVVFFSQGRYTEAAERLPSDPADPTWEAEEVALRARISANLGQLEDAAQWSEKALAMDKLNAGLHHLHAIILEERGMDEGAAISFRRALYLDPDLVMAHFALGNLELRRKRFKAGHRHFTNALALANRYQDGEVLPHSDGLAAGGLKAMVQSALSFDRSA